MGPREASIENRLHGPTRVCYCRRVDQQDIRESIRLGAASLDAVMQKTGAGTSCGSCYHDIERAIRRAQVELRDAARGQTRLPF